MDISGSSAFTQSAHIVFSQISILQNSMASILLQEATPTFNATANATAAAIVRIPASYEYNVMVRVLSVLLLVCSGCLVTGLGWRERKKKADAQQKRDQLLRFFIAKLDSIDGKLLGVLGYCVESTSGRPQLTEGAEGNGGPAPSTADPPIKYAVIRYPRPQAERDALVRLARAMASTCAGPELLLDIPPLLELRLKIVQDSGQCDICANTAAQDIVGLGGCVHTLCCLCASRVKTCPFCRAPLVDAATGVATEEARGPERQQQGQPLATQVLQRSSVSVLPGQTGLSTPAGLQAASHPHPDVMQGPLGLEGETTGRSYHSLTNAAGSERGTATVSVLQSPVLVANLAAARTASASRSDGMPPPELALRTVR